MLNYHLNTRFIKQFRHDYPLYIWKEELHCLHFYFRQYAGNGKERGAIEKFLAKKWDDGKNSRAIIHYLKREAIPASAALSALTQKLVNRFQLFEKGRLQTTVIYHKLLPVLSSLLEIENTFRDHILKGSLQRFKNDSLDAAETICSEDVEALHKLTTHYLASVNKHYSKFNRVLLPKTAAEFKMDISSKDDKNLLKIRVLLENSIHTIERLGKQLQQWKIKIAHRELRELYN